MKSSLLKTISHFGIRPGVSETDAGRIRLVNLLALIPFPFYIFATTYCLIFDYLRIVYANAIPLLAIPLILFLNNRLKYSAAKILFICSNLLVVFIYFKLMDNEKSMFFYYFPLLLCFMLFYDPQKEKKALFATAIFSAAIIALTLFLPAAVFEPSPLSPALHNFIFVFNAFSTVIILVLYTYYIFKANRQKEKQLIEAKEMAENASRAKAQFLSNMSHELRTPLNGIAGTVNILKMETANPELTQHFAVMSTLSEHMLALVNDILDFSKIESGKLELHEHPFNIYLLLKRLNGFFVHQFRSKRVSFVIETDPAIQNMYVKSDDLRLQQVLTNLISNALKFTEHGQVILKTTLLQHTTHSAIIRFSVKDEGIGISPEKIKSIFESFNQGDSGTTRKYGGTGLGLSISSNLVGLLGGELKVESELNKGSEFYFTVAFTLTEKPITSPFKKLVFEKDHLRNKKVLIAEDNPINMNVAKTILTKCGIEVDEAANGKIAVEKCSVKDYDLVLIDLEMPEMDGKTAMKEITGLPHTPPVIAFTAGIYENMAEDLLQQGFVGHVFKPFRPEELVQKIADVIL